MKRLKLLSVAIFALMCCTALEALCRNRVIAITPEVMSEAQRLTLEMPMRERVAQLMMPVVKMFDMDSARIQIDKYVGECRVGGILFYKGECAEQIELYNRAASATKHPIMVAIDGEWGLNMRLRHTPRFPVNMALGAVQDMRLIHAYGEEMGRQCRRMGISVNFAPSVDVNSNPENPVIGRRSYGDDKEAVADRAIAYASGLEKAGVLSCAKHFPGHGDTNQDSHKTLPTVSRSRSDVFDIDLYPFRRYVEAGLGSVMVAHLNVPALDSITGVSTSLSPVVIDGLLRHEMDFDGLVFTDDLDMKGVTKYDDVCVRALLAGNDVLVMPVDVERSIGSVLQALDEGRISEECINAHCSKVLAYKLALRLDNQPISAEGILQDLNNKECYQLISALVEKSVTLVSDLPQIAGRIDARKSALIALGDDENLRYRSLGDTLVTALEFYRYIDGNFGKVVSYNSRTEQLPQLGKHEQVVVEVFSAKQRYIDALAAITKRCSNVVVVFYVNPYEMLTFKNSLRLDRNTVICAYEDTYHAQRAAQEALQGRIAFEGKMPVKISLER